MIREFHHISLRDRNSFGVEQQAARLAEFETADDLRAIFAGGAPAEWCVLSGGNNILFTRDYDGLLLTPAARGIAVTKDEGDRVYVRAEAGVEWDDLVEWAVERGLWGIENLSLIPGKAGAAPVQNIGAYGCEAKDVIERVEMFCVETGTMLTLDAAHCGFGYRESVFKHTLRGRVVITAVELRLSRTPQPRLDYGDVAREGEALLRPTDSLFRQYPAYTIPSTEQERKCLCGNPLRAKLPDGLYRVYGRDGAFLALSEAKDGTLTSKRNFFSV